MPAAADGRAGAPLRPWRSALFGGWDADRATGGRAVPREWRASGFHQETRPAFTLAPGSAPGCSALFRRRRGATGVVRGPLCVLGTTKGGRRIEPPLAAIVTHGSVPSSVRRPETTPGMQRAGMSPKGCLTPTADSVPGRDYIARGACSSVAHVGRLSRVLGWLLWLTRTFAPKIDPAFPRRTARYSASADQSTPSAHGHHALANSANRRDSEQERPLVHHAAPPPLARGRRPAALPSIQPSDSAAGRPGAVCCIRHVTTFSMATNEYIRNGKEKAEFQ
jgi:hypothetical protein